jgi:RNA polymerase sigma-70 factor (ECF subfamily)
MNETSLSLLARIRQSADSESWNRLVDLYAPLIRAWLRKYDVRDSDADDLAQEVLLAVSKDLGKFEHGGQPGSFRGWLKAILVNRLRKFWRARDHRPQVRGDSDIDARLAQLDDPASEMSQIWNPTRVIAISRQAIEEVEGPLEEEEAGRQYPFRVFAEMSGE